uniref:Insulin like growth factor binding protein 3 n=1 Tax=Gallus gallus TaxID=9031 RepID=A0A8V0XYC0_CHICK
RENGSVRACLEHSLPPSLPHRAARATRGRGLAPRSSSEAARAVSAPPRPSALQGGRARLRSARRSARGGAARSSSSPGLGRAALAAALPLCRSCTGAPSGGPLRRLPWCRGPACCGQWRQRRWHWWAGGRCRRRWSAANPATRGRCSSASRCSPTAQSGCGSRDAAAASPVLCAWGSPAVSTPSAAAPASTASRGKRRRGRCRLCWRAAVFCTNATAGDKLRAFLLPGPHAAGNSSDSEEDRSTSSLENQAIPSLHRVPDSNLPPQHIRIDIIRKEQAKNTQRYKVEYDSQSTDTLNFSSESKQETEYGPCRREMEDTLNHLKILNVLSPRGFHIPNCDKKGFYKKKQCRPSKGRKRGYCWCVDKYGQPLPGYDGKGKGDVHCYNLGSK